MELLKRNIVICIDVFLFSKCLVYDFDNLDVVLGFKDIVMVVREMGDWC